MRTFIAAVLLGILALAAPSSADDPQVAMERENVPSHDLCNFEDGSGQRLCIWDAEAEGNGVGDSFIAIRGGTKQARYVYISHTRAHRLSH